MTLRWRLMLTVSAVVIVTILFAWLVAGHLVIKPFADRVHEAHLLAATQVAEEVEQGRSISGVATARELKIQFRAELPRRMRGPRAKKHCFQTQVRGRQVVRCRGGPRAPIAVETASGWLMIRRELDTERPFERVGHFLLIVLGLSLAIAAWLSVIATRPLQKTVEAMDRVARGDLEHRLPEQGVAELAELGAAFNRMAARVEAMVETERVLMAGISHELRTPLARLRLETEILREAGAVSASRLDAMEGDLQALDQLIGELLDISRSTLAQTKLDLSEVDLRALVDGIVEQRDVPVGRIRVLGGLRKVRGDQDRLRRALGNLIDNALKYSPPDSEVLVEVGAEGVVISDRGIGVPEDALDRIFEPFYRASEARAYAGHGLGLMIVRQIANLHGGRVFAERRPEGGLSIHLALPTP